MSDTRPVLVAVDGSPASTVALRYGAVRAQALGVPLRLIHVAPTYLPLAAMAPLGAAYMPEDFEAIGRTVLDAALTVAKTLLDEDRVSGTMVVGARAARIISAAHEARELIVGEDRMPLIERLAGGSVVASVAAGSDVPVIAVPETWSVDHEFEPRVVVGVKDYENVPTDFLRAAFKIAHERGATLDIVYVWDLPSVYGDVVTSFMDDSKWQTTAAHFLRKAALGVNADFGDVRFQVVVAHGRPERILQERSNKATLMLLGRKAHGFPFGHFGHTGHGLLRSSACPIEVLPFAEKGPTSADLAEGTSLPDPRVSESDRQAAVGVL